MRDSIIKYTLVVSLLLNFSMLGAAAYTHYKGLRHRGAPIGCSDAHANYVFKQLSLGAAQGGLMQCKASAFHITLDVKGQEVLAKKATLLGLMRADVVDDAAISEAISRINRDQEEIQKMVVAHILEFKGMLDTKQQQKFLDLIDQAMTGRDVIECPQQ